MPRHLLEAAAVALLLVSLVDGAVSIPAELLTRHPADLTVTVLRVVLGLLGVALIAVLVVAKRAKASWALSSASLLQIADLADRPNIRQYSAAELTGLAASSEIPEPRARAYANLVVGVCGRTAHTTETYELRDHAMTRAVTHHFELSRTMRDEMKDVTTIPFPIMTVAKGFLPDGLRVSLADGKQLSVMPYETVLRLQLKTLQTLYRECMGDTASQGLFSDACHQVGRNGPFVAGTGTYEPAGALDAAFEDEFARRNPQPPPGSPQATIERHARAHAFLKKLKGFVRTYTDAYPVCVELSREDLRGHLGITFVHTTKVLEANDGWRDSVRMWLGLAPYKFRVPLVLPYLAKSYHLSIQTDPRLYLFSQSIEDSQRRRWTLENAPANGGPVDPPYVRRKVWNPLSQSHLHMRGFQSQPAEDLFAFVRFDERPPGTVGALAMLLGISTVLIGFMGYLCSLGRTSSELDIVALVIALPGVAAVMLGEGRSFANPNTSITTRLGLGATIGLSALGVLLWGAQAKGAMKFPVPGIGLGGMHLPIEDGAWLVLLLVASSVTAYVFVGYMGRALAYRRKYFSQAQWVRHDRRPDIEPTHEGMGLLPAEAPAAGGNGGIK